MLGLALTLVACTGSGGSAPSLDGTSWVVTKIRGDATIADHQPTIAFSAQKVSGSASCNQFSGGYTQNGPGLSFSPLAMTAMACSDQSVTAQETSFIAALSVVARISGDANNAELLDASAQVVVTLTKPAQPAPAKPLLTTTWQLATISDNGTATTVLAASPVTLTMGANGESFSGQACNRFAGALSINGSKIDFTNPVSTKMACATAGAAEQESAVLSILAKVDAWSIEGSQLKLSAPGGSGLDFAAK